MPQQHSQAYYTKEQRFNDRFPIAIVAVLAIIQMITTFGIIALEFGHIIINIRLTNLFAGFWTSIPFTILWISMYATVCCCRRRSCATHALIQNCISLIFACALIGINIAFLRRPYDCFFTEGICNNISWVQDISLSFECFFDDQSNDCRKTRLALIKAQLAAGFIMAITCFLYLILYCTVASRVSQTDRRQVSAADAVMAPVYQHPLPPTISYQNQPYTIPIQTYQPSAPVMMPAYQQITPNNNNNNVSYLPPNQQPTLYPNIQNNQF